jgi:hypothetical protein
LYEYETEIAQDMYPVWGIDADTNPSNDICPVYEILGDQECIQSTLSLLCKRRELINPHFAKGDLGGLYDLR